MAGAAPAPAIEVMSSNSIDGSVVFHVVYDVIAFLLYMHQQIPAVLQGMTRELSSLQAELKDSEEVVVRGEMNASTRRKYVGRRREINQQIRRVEKLTNAVSNLRTAFELLIAEVPVEDVVLILGPSPRRPQYVYEMCFASGRRTDLQAPGKNISSSKTTDSLSKKVIRALISKGVGSSSYSGASKLFLMVKAPVSFSMPLHFLPNREFKCSKKVVPLRLKLKCACYFQEGDTAFCHDSKSEISDSVDSASDNLIWFQCRHVIKGVSSKDSLPEE